MKRILPLFIVILFLSGCSGNGNRNESLQDNKNNTGKADLVFSKTEHDFGLINEGEKVGTIFSFLNSGDGDLIISSASTSCGCTVPKFSNKPVPPGSSGTMEVVFDSSNREGKQTKTVTVRSNAATPVIVLRITADISTN